MSPRVQVASALVIGSLLALGIAGARQVEVDSTFVNLFEDSARALGLDLDAAAFGLTGSGAGQALFRCLEVIRQIRVNEVVHVFCQKDLLDGSLEEERPPTWSFLKRDSLGSWYVSGRYQYADERRGIRRFLKALLMELYLPSFVSYRIAEHKVAERVRRGWQPVIAGEAVMFQFRLGRDAPPEHVAAVEHWEDVVAHWKALSDVNGVRFRVLYVPWPSVVDGSVFVASGGPGERWGIRDLTREFCAREGIGFLDPTERFLEATGRGGARLSWLHLNNAGHRAMAAFLISEWQRGGAEAIGPPSGPG